MPLRQGIYFEAEALEEIRDVRINGNSARPYTIKQGTRIIVDSIFRDIQKVRLKLADSIIITCPLSNLKGKLQGDIAG